MVYRFLRSLARLVCFLGRVRVEGLDNFPVQDAVIIAANHRSFWDPIVVAAFAKRPIHFMAKEELFEHELLAALLKQLNAFPVKRGVPDRKALRKALALLDDGQVLGIFPEGTRSKTGELAKPHTGIAMLALKGQAQVVPVACTGTDRVWLWGWKSPIIIRFGEPVRYEEHYGTRLNTAVLEEVSQDIMDRIFNLLPS